MTEILIIKTYPCCHPERSRGVYVSYCYVVRGRRCLHVGRHDKKRVEFGYCKLEFVWYLEFGIW
jgi:hypothetical protein